MPLVTPEALDSVQPDYIIVGGGNSGLALAARLSENPDINVLVVEAGVHHGPTPEIDTPGYMGRNSGNPKFDWRFSSVPQQRAHNRVVPQPRGKGLGGSTILNYMGIFRPTKHELDAFEELGNPGWNWDSLLYYFKKSEFLQLPDLSPASALNFAAKPDPAFHGTDGPVKQSFSAQWSDIHSSLFETAVTLGAPRNPDTGNGKNDGCMTAPVTVDATTAKRCYAAPAYLEPNLHRKNLLVLTEAQVTKILFEDDGQLKKATGIECLIDGSLIQIKNVKRDVVISAGSYQSPQILELSGIGNPAILSKFGIKTMIDLPGVGENLQDHIGVPTIAEVNTKDETMDVLADPEMLKKHQELYEHQKGLLATVPASAFVFLSADALGSEEDIKSWKEHAHAQCTDSLANVIPSLRSGLEKQYEIQQSFLDDKKHSQAELLNVAMHPFVLNVHPEPGKRYTSLLCALLHPFSRGTVHITSADPLTPPAIDPNYFANEADLACIVRALQFGLKVYRTQPFAGHVVKQVLPPPDAIARGEEGLKDYIRGYSRQVFHAVGTAAMMPREDGGVVDPSLKVYGTSNLRMVDCSIVPFELSCHTQSIAYAVGEKAADILKAEIAQT